MKLKRFLCLLGALIAVFVLTVVPIGAEVTPPAAPTFDSSTIYDYPGGNLVQYPYLSFPASGVVVKNGVTFTLQDYGIIISAGQSTATTIVTIGYLDLPAGTYSISGSAAPAVFIAEGYVSGSYVGSWRDTTFTLTQQTRLTLMIYMGSGYTAGGTIYPMINVGSTAYPFQPYLPYYFQQAFNAGWNEAYTLGYQQGYDAGYDDGYHLVNRDLISPMETWSYAEVVVGYMNTSVSSSEQFYTARVNNTLAEVTQTQLIVNNQFNISKIVSDVLDAQTITGTGYILCSSCTLSVYFEDEPLVPSLYSFVGFYPPSTSFRIAALNNGTVMREVTLSASSAPENVNDVAYRYAQSFADFELSIDQIVLTCIGGTSMDSPQTIEDIGFTLGIIDNPNQLAYSQGLEAGLSLNADKAYAAGQRAGYHDGYQVGKTEGLSIAETGTWTELFTSVVEAPVNTFQSLFNFEILGLDMRAAFGSILALCVVLIIVKKVVL